MEVLNALGQGEKRGPPPAGGRRRPTNFRGSAGPARDALGRLQGAESLAQQLTPRPERLSRRDCAASLQPGAASSFPLGLAGLREARLPAGLAAEPLGHPENSSAGPRGRQGGPVLLVFVRT